MTTFRTTVLLGGKTATGLEVPPEVVESFGKGKRVPVTVTIGSHTYRSTIATMDGKFMIPLAAEHRTAAGVAAGDEVDVTLALDTEPRTVEVPADLEAAFAANPGTLETFRARNYSNQRALVLQVEGAKTEATRRRRIAKAIETLLAE